MTSESNSSRNRSVAISNANIKFVGIRAGAAVTIFMFNIGVKYV